MLDTFGRQLLKVLLCEEELGKKIFMERLTKLADSADEKVELRYLVDLAQSLFFNYKWYAAAKVYRLFLHNFKRNALTYQLLKCYVSTANWEAALDICNQIKSNLGFIPEYAEVEFLVYHRINKFEKALPVGILLMERFDNDDYYKIQVAQTYLRLNKDEQASQLFAKIEINSYTETTIIDALITNWMILGEYTKALESAYIYRRLADSKIAHQYYWKVIFNLDTHLKSYFLQPEKVEDDCAVTLKFSNGEVIGTFILESTLKDIKRNELTKNDRRYKQLLSKTIGEEIEWTQNKFGVRKAVIIDIRTKWQSALFETLKFFEVRFDNDDFQFTRGTPEEIFELIQQQIEQRKLINDFFNNIAKAQRKGNYSPMAMVASYLKMSPLELYDIYSNNADLGIRCADGSDNLQQAIKTIEKNKTKKLAADIFGLLTLHKLNIGKEIFDCFGKIKITKTTLDEIKRVFDIAKFELDRTVSESIFSKNGQLYRKEHTVEEKQKKFDYYNSLIEWVEQYCEEMPFVLNKQQIGEKEYDVLTKSSSDTLLMSIQHNLILITDDFIYRKRAEKIFKVTSVWSQALLLYLCKEQQSEVFFYHDKVIQLIWSNYNYVNFNHYSLMAAANQSLEMFFKVASRLGKPYSKFEPSLLYGLSFLTVVWKDTNKDIIQKRALTTAVLISLCTYQNTSMVLRFIYKTITNESQEIATSPQFILAVEDWARLSGVYLRKS